MLERREIILGGALSLIWGRACCQNSGQIYGCRLPDQRAEAIFSEGPDTRLFISGNEPMIPKSGNQMFDRALAQSLSKMSSALDCAPGFAYFDDAADGANAYATAKRRLNGADGTVLFGSTLLSQLMAHHDNPELRVAAVCAHEFGHILQFKRGLEQVVGAGQPTVKRIELQADYFAGYFAGRRKRERPAFPAAVFAATQQSFGDTHVNSPGHHGTSVERASAVVSGFKAAYEKNLNLGDAIQESVTYVRSL